MGPARSADLGRRPGARPAGPAGRAGPVGPAGHHGIPPQFWRAFPGRSDQVAEARRFIARALAACPAVTDAVLLTGELATNAVQHTATGQGGIFAVAISHGPGRVLVTVTDNGSPGRPAVAAADDMSTSGRGLILVNCLAARWGHTGRGDHRRGQAGPARATVWFELACA